MNREQEYRLLADNAFTRAVEEDSAQLMAQWKILGARYLELADQSKRESTKTRLTARSHGVDETNRT
jgi:hypothetical protein